MKRFEILERRRVYQGFASVDEYQVRVETTFGEMEGPMPRTSVELGDAVGVLIFDREEKQFLLVRQCRIPIARHEHPWLLEIVAGKIDPGEAPEATARREVEEEIGYRVPKIEWLGEMYGSPGAVSEKLTLYFAEVGGEDRVSQGGGVDAFEDVEVVRLSPKETWDLLDTGKLKDAKSQIALLRVRARFPS